LEKCHILSLSGGGYKGLYTARILNEIEKQFHCPIANKFDLLAGTSIGGIIAIALALEIPTSEIIKIFEEHGKEIFCRPRKWPIFKSKYENANLKQFLESLFGDKKIGDLKHRIIIPTFNYTTGKPQLLKTRHNEKFHKDIECSLVDAALATSAAPTYFPVFRKTTGDFIDGGIVANNPAPFACIEAYKFLGIPLENIYQLHIGTTLEDCASTGKVDTRNTGLVHWVKRLISLSFASQEQSCNNMLNLLLGDRCYVINTILNINQGKVIGLDKVNETSTRLLNQHAADAAKDFMGKDFFKIIQGYIADNFEQIPLPQGDTK